MTNAKEQFYEKLNETLEICVFSEGTINDADLLTIAENYKDTYKIFKGLVEENRRIQDAFNDLRESPYYKRHVKNKKNTMLTLEEKTQSPLYGTCGLCDNLVKHSYLKSHKRNDCCRLGCLKKEFAKKKHRSICDQFSKQTLHMDYWLINIYPKERRQGQYDKECDMRKIYASMR
tara:strand:+ start:37 stop:561 length:525 start_codon:yes stop_codon:yes gene_type:complete